VQGVPRWVSGRDVRVKRGFAACRAGTGRTGGFEAPNEGCRREGEVEGSDRSERNSCALGGRKLGQPHWSAALQ